MQKFHGNMLVFSIIFCKFAKETETEKLPIKSNIYV